MEFILRIKNNTGATMHTLAVRDMAMSHIRHDRQLLADYVSLLILQSLDSTLSHPALKNDVYVTIEDQIPHNNPKSMGAITFTHAELFS